MFISCYKMWRRMLAQGGCTYPNDGITDTPEASDAANYVYSCNDMQDSCPTSPGLDPVRNYMSYT